MTRTGTGTTAGLSRGILYLSALSLSIGWGVRGNWGHEFGAMIPGALAAMAACLLSGREDWRRRVAYFAFFGALGWSFGGSMSYGMVLGYTHSASWPSVLYGFACLFAIGFLWGAIGGSGTALPAFLDRERLTELFYPLSAVLLVWTLQFLAFESGLLKEDAFNWYDTDWLAALLAVTAVATLGFIRGRFCFGSHLILCMAAGWWLAFLLLVVGLGIRMTPPRGDNWAGCLGMTVALFLFLWRKGLTPVVFAGLVTAFFAGLGFSTAELIKLLGVSTGIVANWHSVMEQTFGLISGIGVAVAMIFLSKRLPAVPDEPPVRYWTEVFSVGFVLLVIPFLNIRKNLESVWLPNHVLPVAWYGHSAAWWFNLAYLAVALTVIFVIVRHQKIPLSVIPATWLGKGQALFLVFLWWIVIGNLSRYLPFDPQRMITEGIIHLNACLCTLLVLTWPLESDQAPPKPFPRFGLVNFGVLLVGFLFCLGAIYGQSWAAMRILKEPTWGYHYRFDDAKVMEWFEQWRKAYWP
ncbi:MAG: hypothetical protein ACE15F_14150 [bacterium]